MDILIARAKGLARSGDNSGAMKLAEEIVTRYPGHFEAWLLRSYLSELARDFDSALDDISKSIEINPMEPHLHYSRGRYLFHRGSFAAAVVDFEKALELSDFHRNNYYRDELNFWCAESLLKLGRKREASEHLSTVPNDFSSWTVALRTKRDLLDDCTT